VAAIAKPFCVRHPPTVAVFALVSALVMNYAVIVTWLSAVYRFEVIPLTPSQISAAIANLSGNLQRVDMITDESRPASQESENLLLVGHVAFLILTCLINPIVAYFFSRGQPPLCNGCGRPLDTPEVAACLKPPTRLTHWAYQVNRGGLNEILALPRCEDPCEAHLLAEIRGCKACDGERLLDVWMVTEDRSTGSPQTLRRRLARHLLVQPIFVARLREIAVAPVTPSSPPPP
jgi:hypothetical protein